MYISLNVVLSPVKQAPEVLHKFGVHFFPKATFAILPTSLALISSYCRFKRMGELNVFLSI
jgi:hypothetical protein